MAVSFGFIAGILVIAVLILVALTFYMLCKKKRVASSEESNLNRTYKKLEDGEFDSGEDGVKENEPKNENKNEINKKKEKRNAGKLKSKMRKALKASGDLDACIESHAEYDNSSSAQTEDVNLPLLGKLQISASYVKSQRQLLLTVHRGENLGIGAKRQVEVRVTLLPSKRQRFKTKCRQSGNPIYDEIFVFNELFPQDLEVERLRARVYRLNGRRRTLIGEFQADLMSDLKLDNESVNTFWMELIPKTEMEDDISDTILVTDPETALGPPKETLPMLLISLQYKSLTARLTVEIIKARHMKMLSMQKAPESFVEVSLLNSNGGELGSAKTAVQKKSFHPTFEETFYFSAIEYELASLTMVFSVFCKKFRRKQLVGWFSIGRESTGEREELHWSEMIDGDGEVIKGWYVLKQD